MAISVYEQLRLTKIAANEAKLKSLDLDSSYMKRQLAIEKQNQNQNKKKTKKRPLPSTFVVQRKSSRTTTAPKVDYTTTKIITSSFPSTSNFNSKSLFNLPNLPDDHDFVAELKATKTREENSSDALQSISEFISSMKTRISSSSDLPPLEKDAVEQLRISGDFSHAEAITRWGLGVEASSPAAAPRSKEFWDKFVSSRSSTNDAPLSPTAFLQEHFQHDGYQLLVACLLMSRVSSHETKERCIKAFFDLCPTPTEFFYVDSAKLAEAIRSLGMQESRVKGLVAVTEKWLGLDGDPEFKIDLKDEKIFGCGAFTVDSYMVFFKGEENFAMNSNDACVVSYQRWLKERERSNK
ncbi:hypothetical protein ScalyP_jg10186 [Parmales sp. scaly parma]|nr:hypothetical protein ScalyP_jg10186 [Parmales sp. scaly parma]